MKTRFRFAAIVISVLLLHGFLSAAPVETAPVRRPKIALVLEGGAALGLAHIGVIEWLEQHRVPISYIAGTSMGGLVGGMYATGETPRQMRELVAGVDWVKTLRGETPYDDLSFRRKEDRREYPNSLEFGVR